MLGKGISKSADDSGISSTENTKKVHRSMIIIEFALHNYLFSTCENGQLLRES